MLKRDKCPGCGRHPRYHILSWIDAIMERVIPSLKIPPRIDAFLDLLIERALTAVSLVEMRSDFSLSDIQPRSACFITEARKRGVSFRAAYGPAGYTGNFYSKINERELRFSVLPVADHLSQQDSSFTKSKERTKQRLINGGFPVAQGKAFSFYQKRAAVKFGSETLGFPLVVKPQFGSVARHVTTNIRSKEALRGAIESAIKNSPAFIVERFIEDSAVHRVTVVDFEFVAVVKQVPANVRGDGRLTIRELAAEKNAARQRENSRDDISVLRSLVIDDTTEQLLAAKGYTLSTVPPAGETVYLQQDPFLALGGDLVEVTEAVHPDNVELFQKMAKFFDLRLVGIDFMAGDISTPFSKQTCAVLELNSVPCIEMHHFPSSGRPQNVAGALVDLFFSAYS